MLFLWLMVVVTVDGALSAHPGMRCHLSSERCCRGVHGPRRTVRCRRRKRRWHAHARGDDVRLVRGVYSWLRMMCARTAGVSSPSTCARAHPPSPRPTPRRDLGAISHHLEVPLRELLALELAEVHRDALADLGRRDVLRHERDPLERLCGGGGARVEPLIARDGGCRQVGRRRSAPAAV